MAGVRPLSQLLEAVAYLVSSGIRRQAGRGIQTVRKPDFRRFWVIQLLQRNREQLGIHGQRLPVGLEQAALCFQPQRG